jgi:hypothetical protein
MLIVDSVNHGDTDACTFTWKMYWGDGKTEIVTQDGGDQPTLFKALHFYKEPSASDRRGAGNGPGTARS